MSQNEEENNLEEITEVRPIDWRPANRESCEADDLLRHKMEVKKKLEAMFAAKKAERNAKRVRAGEKSINDDEPL